MAGLPPLVDPAVPTLGGFKKAHLGGSMAATLVLAGFLSLVVGRSDVSMLFAGMASVGIIGAIGIAKEFLFEPYLGPLLGIPAHAGEWRDVGANSIGSGAALLFVLVVWLATGGG